jgi:poly-gamma-glutamate synthesis protein (capsule biosynthesis protein)
MSEWSLIAGGDLCGCRSQETDPFDQEIKNLIQNSSISIGNLEAPLDAHSKSMVKSGPTICMNRTQFDAVLTSGISGFSMANNHMMDFGIEGVAATKEYLDSKNLISFGADINELGAYEPSFHLIDDKVTVALIGVSEQEFGASEGGLGGVGILTNPLFSEAVRKAKNLSDVLIVSVHGGVELSFLPPPVWRNALRGIIELGADIVLGHHPHVIQGIESFMGGFIAYSLGDLWWPRSGNNEIQKRSIGLLIEFKFEAKKIVKIFLHPVILTSDHKVKFIKGEGKKKILGFIDSLSNLYSEASYDKLWLDYASYLYQDRYAGRIFGVSAVNNNVKNFFRYMSVGFLNLLEKFFKINTYTLEQQKLFFLNTIRNPSQRNICELGLSVRGKTISCLPDKIKKIEAEFSNICSSI